MTDDRGARQGTALSDPERRRIELTSACSDADPIPKVPGAGEVFEREGARVQRMHEGSLVLADGYSSAWMTELIRRLRGHHEPQEELVFHELLRHVRPGALMLELGSSWSYYTIWFLRAVRGARALCLEPDARNLEVGRRNLALNGLEARMVHAAAAASFEPSKEFTADDGARTTLRHTSVDELREQELGGASIELLLMDIQGAELRALAGAEHSIRAGRLRFLMVSTHHHSISGDPLLHERCLERVRALGGHVLAEHTVSESFSGDGLIAASFDPADRNLPVIRLSRCRAASSLFPPVEHDLAAALERERALAREVEETRHLIHRLRTSRSWRATEPLRKVAEALRGRPLGINGAAPDPRR